MKEGGVTTNLFWNVSLPKLRGVFFLGLFLFAGCFSAQQNREARPESQQSPDRVVVYEESQFPEAAYTVLGQVVGTACQTDVYSQSAKRSDALADMRRKAGRRGANALFDVSCQKNSDASECMSALRCTGRAARMASVRSLLEMDRRGETDGFDGDSVSKGTGWVVSPTLVATAHDVVRGHSEFTVSVQDTKLRAQLVASDPTHNLALLRPHEPSALPPAIPISSTPPQLGQEVFTVGYVQFGSQMLEMRASSGIISAQSGLFGDPRLYQTTLPSPFKNSSTPLLDFRGQVIGMVLPSRADRSGRRPGNDSGSFSYAVKGEHLTALTDSVSHSGQKTNEGLVRAEASLSTLLRRVRASVLVVSAE